MANYTSKRDLILGKRFIKICENLFPNWSRQAIADKLGVANESRIRLFEQGSIPETSVLNTLDRLGVSLEWFLINRGEMMQGAKEPQHIPITSVPSKPALPAVIPFPTDTRPAASMGERQTRGLAAADDSHGSRVPDTDEEGDPYKFPPRLVMVPVTGDSMSPVVLEKQYVFIDAEREGFEKNDGIYIVSILEPEPQDERPEPLIGTFIKRCELHEDMLYLKSINADYSPFSVYIDHCRLWPVLGTWYDDKGKPPEGF